MKIGKQTIKLENKPRIISTSNIVGKKEMDGPLGSYFDAYTEDEFFGEKTFEKAESKLIETCLNNLIKKAKLENEDIDYIFGGDLLNQCIANAFSIKNFNIPYLGLYGACSTFVESSILASLFVNAGYANKTVSVSSSHFCTAERQFRLPLEHGNQKSPTAQCTVTASGSMLFCNNADTNNKNPCVTYVTPGKIVDMGIKDMTNMGAAMAGAAIDTIITHLKDTKRSADYYDAILTGDLGVLGSEILIDLCQKQGFDLSKVHFDAGKMIYDIEAQDAHCGGSGCGCVASVFTSYFFNKLKSHEINKILVVATGALMSTTSSMQGDSIPGIAHAIAIENEV